jgi:hypothetical protein
VQTVQLETRKFSIKVVLKLFIVRKTKQNKTTTKKKQFCGSLILLAGGKKQRKSIRRIKTLLLLRPHSDKLLF